MAERCCVIQPALLVRHRGRKEEKSGQIPPWMPVILESRQSRINSIPLVGPGESQHWCRSLCVGGGSMWMYTLKKSTRTGLRSKIGLISLISNKETLQSHRVISFLPSYVHMIARYYLVHKVNYVLNMSVFVDLV